MQIVLPGFYCVHVDVSQNALKFELGALLPSKGILVK